MKKSILLLIILCLVMGASFYGCTQQNVPMDDVIEESENESNPTENADQQTEEPSLEKADKDANDFIYLLQKKDISGLDTVFKNAYYYTPEIAAKVITGFEKYYDLSTLRVEPVHSDNPSSYDYFFNVIGSKDGEERSSELTVSYDPKNDYKLNYNHLFIRYYPQAEEAVGIYLDYLEKGDPGELSSYLSIDIGPEYYREEAEQLIAEYNEMYDLNSATYEYIGFIDNLFVFVMTDGNQKTREIKVGYGDGLVGIHEQILLN